MDWLRTHIETFAVKCYNNSCQQSDESGINWEEGLIGDFYQISLLDGGNYVFAYEVINFTDLLTEILLENYNLFSEKTYSRKYICLKTQLIFMRISQRVSG